MNVQLVGGLSAQVDAHEVERAVAVHGGRAPVLVTFAQQMDLEVGQSEGTEQPSVPWLAVQLDRHASTCVMSVWQHT